MSRAAVIPLDPATYQRHALHGEDRAWIEKNCYVDIWIELLHAQGLEPMAMLPFTVAVDFEDDQWTFFKPPHTELWDLFGVDVQEMTVWQPLVQHAARQTAAGKLVSTEADAFFLPDTRGTDYRAQHTKTTIIVNDIDVEARRLGYFHNAGYYVLDGDDFAGLFRLGVPPDPAYMPYYAELIRVDRARRLPPADLRVASSGLLARHLGRRPAENPIARFSRVFADDIARLQTEGLGRYHVYAFATVRQMGAAFELLSLYLRWLAGSGAGAEGSPLWRAAGAFNDISAGAKALILKGARAVGAKRAADFATLLDDAASAWQRGMDTLAALVGGHPA
ncbi:MAG TPA: DUF1839 family protein [Polyangia bacterium]|nr:DUF1839 family protein [Polyangia bacterium]